MQKKKRFSAAEWESAHSEPETFEPQQDKSVSTKPRDESASELLDRVSSIVEEIESQRIDIAPQYDDWVKVGFALADGMGELGREFFHRLSRQHDDCDETKTDKQYTYCLRGKGQGITISTFFHYVEQSGIQVVLSKKPKTSNNQNGNLEIWKNVGNLEPFQEEIFQNLPVFLKEVVDNAIAKADRDMVLMGALGCLSACMDNVYGIYDHRKVYPNLYLFVVADSGMGKGALTLCRELVAPIDRQKKKRYEELHSEYQRNLAEYLREKKKNPDVQEPTPPRQQLFVIPANSSASSFLSLLADNDGVGLLFESEGDTLSQTLKSEHGNYSDLLRKCYHHESVSMSRRKDRELIDLETPKLSVVLSGTPNQVLRLIPKTEDGLFSRFSFYILPFKEEIRDVFMTIDEKKSKQAVFKNLGERFYHVYEKIRKHGQIAVQLPVSLQKSFVEWLRGQNAQYCHEYGNFMQGVVRRIGLMAFRIMMILTVLRNADNLENVKGGDHEEKVLICNRQDYDTAVAICEKLVSYSSIIYKNLYAKKNEGDDTQEKGVSARRYALFGMLPDEFSKKEYDNIVAEANENLSTATKWINQFINEGVLKRTAHGGYMKVK